MVRTPIINENEFACTPPGKSLKAEATLLANGTIFPSSLYAGAISEISTGTSLR